jgi:hypothetical protein
MVSGVAFRNVVIGTTTVADGRHILGVGKTHSKMRHDVVGLAGVLGVQDGGGGMRDAGQAPPSLRLAQVIVRRAKLEIDILPIASRCAALVGGTVIDAIQQIRPRRVGDAELQY